MFNFREYNNYFGIRKIKNGNYIPFMINFVQLYYKMYTYSLLQKASAKVEIKNLGIE